MRQTSGALRQTEGNWRPRRARTIRKSVTREALEPHGKACGPRAREIPRPDRHLCRHSRRRAAQAPHRSTQNSKPSERLKPRRRNLAKSNSNCADKSCGKRVAKRFAQVFLVEVL